MSELMNLYQLSDPEDLLNFKPHPLQTTPNVSEIIPHINPPFRALHRVVFATHWHHVIWIIRPGGVVSFNVARITWHPRAGHTRKPLKAFANGFIFHRTNDT